MHDQANQLRHLVQQDAHLAGPAPGQRPVIVTLTGAKGGVGTTTVAVSLAVVLARLGHRTVLVDADLDGGDASLACRVDQRLTIDDVLSARRTLREVLQSGPGGIAVVPGIWGLENSPEETSAGRQRLVEGLQGLGRQFDYVLVDAGNSLRPMVRSLWETSNQVLVVSTTEPAAVMDAYASIKAHSAGNVLVPVHLVLNRVAQAAEAEDAQKRIATACLRFLALPVSSAGRVAADEALAACVRDGKTPVLAAPSCPASAQLQSLGRFVVSQAEDAARPSRGRIHRPENLPATLNV